MLPDKMCLQWLLLGAGGCSFHHWGTWYGNSLACCGCTDTFARRHSDVGCNMGSNKMCQEREQVQQRLELNVGSYRWPVKIYQWCGDLDPLQLVPDHLK